MNFQFNFRDLPHALRLALFPQRLLMGIAAVSAISGCIQISAGFSAGYAEVFALSMIFLIHFFAATAINNSNWRSLQNRTPNTLSLIFRKTAATWMSLPGAMGILAFMLTVFLLLMTAAVLPALLPVAGQWIFFALLPLHLLIALALAWVLTILTLTISLGPALLPALESDALGAVYYPVQFLQRKPLQLLGYSLLSVLLAAIALLLAIAGIALAWRILLLFIGGIGATALLDTCRGAEDIFLMILNRMFIEFNPAAVSSTFALNKSAAWLSTPGIIARYVLWNLFLLLPAGYAYTVLQSALLLSVTAIYQQQEGENLLKRVNTD